MSRVTRLHQRSRRRVSLLLACLGFCVVAIIILAGLWRLAEERLLVQAGEIRVERADLKQKADHAIAAEKDAREAERQARQALSTAREHYRSQLAASRLTSDRLFAWAMERDRRQLPPLDGREKRLARLESDLLALVEEAGDMPELDGVMARTRLQLAEIAISLGNLKPAQQRFEEARKAWSEMQMDADLRLRMATDSLLIAKLCEGRAETDEAMRSFAVARDLLSKLPRGEVDQDRHDQLLAVLDYREAKLQAQQGNEQQALSQLMRATETLNRISGQRPDVVILHSALADCYLSSASILEGIGKPGDAREVRQLAVGELLKLRKADPRDLDVQDQLAACYAAMADASYLSGDLEGAAQHSEEALGLLKGYLTQRPGDDEAVVRKAGLQGLKAGILRDRGDADAAMELYNAALALLEVVHQRRPEHAMASYRLALIWWQKGRMLGLNGNEEAEIALMVKAHSLLASLEQQRGDGAPAVEQLRRSRAYLAGDLGHARELSGNRGAAREAFRQAVEQWEQLRKMRPRSEEYLQAEQWCRERLQRLGS